MPTTHNQFNKKQLYFKEIFVGTLIYAVVLGFFNDYTSVVYAKSFSTLFLSSIVLEILTLLLFILKGRVVRIFSSGTKAFSKAYMVFSIWLIMFLSKFVFIWVVDLLFGDNMNINGFFGILYVVVSVTLIHKMATVVFKKFGDT